MQKLVKAVLIIGSIAVMGGCREISPTAGSTTSLLPSSVKGYELYSWSEGDDWYFTLITGTNRSKTSAEIGSRGEIVDENGWVKITVLGLHELESVLDRLPHSEQIFWLDGSRLEFPQESRVIALPPDDLVELVHQYSSHKGLNLQIIQ
ncbi:MAG: hypothetical protein ABUK20_06600 [Anaerolineales bacterium]